MPTSLTPPDRANNARRDDSTTGADGALIGIPALSSNDLHTDPAALASTLDDLKLSMSVGAGSGLVAMSRELAVALLQLAHAEVSARVATVALLNATGKKAAQLRAVGDAASVVVSATDHVLDVHAMARANRVTQHASRLFRASSAPAGLLDA